MAGVERHGSVSGWVTQARPGVPARLVGSAYHIWDTLEPFVAPMCAEWSRFGVVMGLRGMGLGAWLRGDLGMGKGMGLRGEYEVPFLALTAQNTCLRERKNSKNFIDVDETIFLMHTRTRTLPRLRPSLQPTARPPPPPDP